MPSSLSASSHFFFPFHLSPSSASSNLLILLPTLIPLDLLFRYLSNPRPALPPPSLFFFSLFIHFPLLNICRLYRHTPPQHLLLYHHTPCSSSSPPLPHPLTSSSALSFPPGQVVSGPEPVQRGRGLLHPGGRPGPGHAGGPGRVLLQVAGRSQAHEGGP